MQQWPLSGILLKSEHARQPDEIPSQSPNGVDPTKFDHNLESLRLMTESSEIYNLQLKDVGDKEGSYDFS